MVFSIKMLLALQLTYVLVHVAIKTSILLLYKRILTFNSQRFRYAWYAVLTYVISCGFVGLGMTVGMCKPIQSLWEQARGIINGTCLDVRAIDVGAGVMMILSDVMILILPMPMLWSLRMKYARKIQLCALCGIGFLFTESFQYSFSDF